MTQSLGQFFNAEQLDALHQKAEEFTVAFSVNAPLEKVWPVIADNNLIREGLGMSPVHFVYQPVVEGGTMLEGVDQIPLIHSHFVEKPFEWVSHRYSYGARIFDHGPLRYGSLRLDAREKTPGETAIRAEVRIVFWGPLRMMSRYQVKKALEQFPSIITRLIERVDSKEPHPFEASLDENPDLERFSRYKSTLSHIEGFPRQVDSLANFAARSSNRFLQRMRPFALADYYQIPRQEMLHFILEGTKRGFLAISWDILCPSCRGAKKQGHSLRDLKRREFCESCGIHFDVLDASDVELSFTFAGDLSVPAEIIYCVGNPGRNLGIHVQLPCAPHQTRSLELHLHGQRYRLSHSIQEPPVRIVVTPTGHTTVDRGMIEKITASGGTLKVQKDFTFNWTNKGEHWQIVRFHCLDPDAYAATADHIADWFSYRRLFGTDALTPGIELSVAQLTFLFSDIRGSTQLYSEVGDFKAFAMVQEHFNVLETLIESEGGSIVKTIGDAVMATFTNEQSALRAAIKIQKQDREKRRDRTWGGIKIALHSGPCMMVNLNDRLDYFGTTVNTCSRLLHIARDEDLTVSDTFFTCARVQEMIESQDFLWSMEHQNLRGLNQTHRIYRIHLESKVKKLATAS